MPHLLPYFRSYKIFRKKEKVSGISSSHSEVGMKITASEL
jgi:hypothetical protein